MSNVDHEHDFDLVCVGFGKKGLALATALADRDPKASILILEKHDRFTDEHGFTSTERQGGSPFLQDLITQQNPRSRYTYINFLHQTRLLLGFTNASQMAPSRALTSRYMAWVAEQMSSLGWISYGQEVLCIRPRTCTRGKTSRWEIKYKNKASSTVTTITASNVVLATGSQKHLPPALSETYLQPYVLALHQSDQLMERIYSRQASLSVAIVGADQEAAELFELLQTLPGQHKATMIFNGTALRTDDATPFSRATVDGSWSNLNHLPPEIRQKVVATAVSAQCPTIDLPTLERLYVSYYAEKVRDLDHGSHRFRMCPSQQVVKAQLEGKRVTLILRDTITKLECPAHEAFDIVMACLERGKMTAETLLDPLSSLLDGGGLTVDSDYAVNFRSGKVLSACGMWVLGTLLDRNARRDDFSILALSAARAVDSIMKTMGRKDSDIPAHELALL